ncbi:MAG: ABC transporter substrate-binding protein, partial [Xenococcaceae cyanobacterium]
KSDRQDSKIIKVWWENRKDLLKQVGLSEKDIPTDWNGFWQFWTKAQDLLRSKQKLDVYGLGLSLSVEAGDTFQTFEQILEAYNVNILDSSGQLQVDRTSVRQGIIEVLDWYTKFYKQSYIPQASLRWLSPDNNRSLLNREILMTVNHTLAIPGAVRQDLDTYRNKIGILEFPNKFNGEPMRHLVTVEQALVFADSEHQQLAKEFLSYMLQPKVMGEYLKSGGGRYAPAIASVWQDPFWSDPQDPHVSVATKTITKGLTRTYYTFQNPAYSKVLQENVWGVALTRIAVDKISSEQAADEAIALRAGEAIAKIKQIFSQWQS